LARERTLTAKYRKYQSKLQTNSLGINNGNSRQIRYTSALIIITRHVFRLEVGDF
jgi:hypothetical protein